MTQAVLPQADQLDDMKLRRGGLVAEARALYDLAKAQGRSFNEVEEQQYNAIFAEINDLDLDIAREEQLRSAEQVSGESFRAAVKPGGGEESQRPGQRITFPRPQKFRSLGENLQAIIKSSQPGATVDTRLLELRALGMNEAVPGEGGFAVETDFVSGLVQRAYDRAPLASRARRMSLSSNANSIKLNTVHETSRANGSRYGGVLAYWAAEAGSVTATKPEIRQVELHLHKLMATCYLTDELMADAGALEAFVRDAYAAEMAFKLDDAILNGTGSGQPVGILTHAATVSVSKETGQAAATLVSENIFNMYSRCWAGSRLNAVWFHNQNIEPQLFQFGIQVGVGGSTVYMPPGGLSASPFGTLFGRPMVAIEQAPTLGTVGDIVFADMNEYLVVDKGGVQSALSVHVAFLTDETVLRFTYRVAGQPLWHSALTPFAGSTLSPFVSLATRA